MAQSSSDGGVAQVDGLVQRYKEAGALVRQKRYREAEAGYAEVIAEGSKTGDPLVLKLVSAALRLRAQCQFHLWQSTAGPKTVGGASPGGQTDQFGQKWRAMLEQRRGNPK